MTKIASAQLNVVFGDADANAVRAIEVLENLARQGVELVAFPEAFLTGYCVDSPADLDRIAISVDHSSMQAIQAACDRLGVAAVVGFAEKWGDRRANSAAICLPGQSTDVFRKLHLPHMGLDRFVDSGEGFKLYEAPFGKFGVLICFDMRPPEASRMLALMGADLIVLPTNWPEGAEVSADHICIARAAENKVFFLSCNRTGEENGFRFIGHSKIIGPTGQVLASAGAEEQILIAEVDMTLARNKQNVTIPEKYETAIFGCRRPELYRLISEGKPDPREGS